MVIDKIGYLPITRTGAMLFFQLMSRRYEHASTVLTSNLAPEPTPEPAPVRYRLAGRDRLVWVPVMQRLAAVHFESGLLPGHRAPGAWKPL
jgi:hypothetical protein